MESIEVTGETIEAAINKGLKELGVGPNDVMVEVLEEPSRGLLGIGAKPGKVRLVLMGGRKPPPPAPTPVVETPKPDSVSSAPKQVAEPPRPNREETTPSRSRDYDEDDDEQEEEETYSPPPVDESEWDDEVRLCRDVLQELINKLGIEGTVGIHRPEGEDDGWLLNVTGKNMRRLIGRRGDTLSSLQYITRLIASRKLQRRANVLIDVDGYKALRSGRLKQLALRMAEQAIVQGRTVYLEPMPAHERRIVHLALHNREDIETKSVGDGSARKVTITPLN